ncbi:hypothetical protein GA0074692_0673 [Micromonospora pallida]|uniref:Uncharacterized protein n=1 Tax=Micromonospora pallida TaxID=145854 RepID=A0A1C6RR43_9ACTN|nr:hypothetical protein [Micromonospora pallida]SCL19656.1 hypothetical protein GA0074692_0673 [Micromonospora pallida]
MTGASLSPAQIQNRLTLSARWILRDHRPGDDGRCPICRVADCTAARTARGYLTGIGQPPPRPR